MERKWQSIREDEDPLRTARGLWNGFWMGMLLWVMMGVVYWWVVNHPR